MKLHTLTATAFLLSATALSANSLTGKVAFGTMFDTSEDLTVTSLTGTVDGTYDFGSSAFGFDFGGDFALVESDDSGAYTKIVDQTELFAALSFDTDFGTFLIGKPRTAMDGVLTRGETYVPAISTALDYALLGNEASKTFIALEDDTKPYGVAFETDTIANTTIGASVHKLGDAYPDLYIYSIAATRSFGAVDLGVGYESLDNNGSSVDTLTSTIKYSAETFSVGLDLNNVTASASDETVATVILSGDWSVSDAVTLGAADTHYSTDDLTDAFFALNAEYAFENGATLNAGIVQESYEENFSSFDATYVTFSAG